MISGQWSVVSGQWSVISSQWFSAFQLFSFEERVRVKSRVGRSRKREPKNALGLWDME